MIPLRTVITTRAPAVLIILIYPLLPLPLAGHWTDLRQKVALASLLVTKRHISIAVVWIEMFGNPGSILALVMIIDIYVDHNGKIRNSSRLNH